MHRVLLGCLLIANLLELAFSGKSSDSIPSSVVKSIYKKCSAKNELLWAMNVTINQPIISTDNSNGGWLYHDSSEESEGEGGLIDYANDIIQKLKCRRKKILKSLCSLIPEPILIPDLNLTRLLTFRAFDGRISGVRQICTGHELPQLVVKDSRIGLKHQLNLGELHFRYHITDKRLRIDRTFDWALSNRSFAVMSIMAGLNKKCILKIQDVGVYLDFDGKDRDKKCKGKCYSILAKLRCYFYHFFAKAIKWLIRPLKKLAKSVVCVSTKGLDFNVA